MAKKQGTVMKKRGSVGKKPLTRRHSLSAKQLEQTWKEALHAAQNTAEKE